MLTISIPVYNEVQFIEKTLASADGQSDHILICDNASTDGTSEICANFAASRPYVRHVRFEKNLGALTSFTACIEMVNTQYILLLGGHDILQKNYAAHCLEALQKHNAVHAYGNVQYINADYSISHEYIYEYAISLMNDSPCIRVPAMCRYLTDCSLYHGVFKTQILAEAMKKRYIDSEFTLDAVVLADIAKTGKSILQTKSRFMRMQARKVDNDTFAMWTRMLAVIFPDKAVEPSLIPNYLYIGRMAILESLTPQNDREQEAIDEAKMWITKKNENYQVILEKNKISNND